MRALTRYHALALMVLCLLIAAMLRLPDLAAVPPGVHYDEAANGILAAEIGQGQSRPIFIPSYTGKEVLFFYLAGLLQRLVGESVWALRLTAVFISLLTISATYWLGRELFRARRVALLAAILLAVSFWHILFSRLGFRAITQPLLQALMVAALLRGLRTGQGRWLLAGGISLGLTAYTYLAARLFPVLLLPASLPLLCNRARWRQLALVGLTGLVTLLPLLFYFYQQPEAFWVRIGQVGASDGGTLLNSYGRALQMFFLRGDPYLRFNIPERPLFSLFWGALLIIGWVMCLLSWRRARADWQRFSVIMLLGAPLIMILPTALATNEILPSNLRAIGLIPFIFYLPALGFVTLLDDLARRWQRPSLATTTFFILSGALLLAEGAVARQLTMQTWGSDPALFYETDGDLTAVAPFLDNLPLQPDETVYVAARHYQHPTLAYLSRRYDEVKWLVGSAALALPAAGSGIYIFPANSPLPEWAAPLLDGAELLAAPEGPDGRPAFTAYRLTAVPPITPANAQNVNFGHIVTLLGYDVGSAAAGDSAPLTLYWQINNLPPADFLPFVHLEDSWGARWSQAQTFAYPAAQWQPGEIVAQRVEVPIPPGAPPGDYRVRLGWFDSASGQRLPVLDDDGRFAGDTFLIPNLAVTAGLPPDPLPQPPFVIDEAIRPGLRLLGFERGAAEIATGERLDLAFWWLANMRPPNLSLRLEAYRSSDNVGRILLTTQPVHGTYPFISWALPQFVIDRQTLPIPDNLEPGLYRLQLRLLQDDAPIYETDLGPLTVRQTERLFTPPPTANPLAATFGNEIKLRGYDLQPGAEVGEFDLRLVWQALTPPTADYTVFVHVLHADGSCCLWQQDVAPQQGQYPTSRWVADEVVVDEYAIRLPPETPPGSYVVEVGLYLPENGRRLQVLAPPLPPSDVVYLHPLVVE